MQLFTNRLKSLGVLGFTFLLFILNSCDSYKLIVTTELSLEPKILDFSCKTGESKSASLTVSTNRFNPVEWKTEKSASWLGLNPDKGNTLQKIMSSDLSVKVDCTGLSLGNYSDTVTVTKTDEPDVKASTKINLNVTNNDIPNGNKPIISLNPKSFSLECIEGQSDPVTASLAITNPGQGTLNWVSSEDADWLTLNSYNGTAPSTVTLSANCRQLSAGSNPSTEITVTSGNASNSPQTAMVNLNVKPPIPQLNLSPNTFNLECYSGSATPVEADMNVTNSGAGSLSWTANEYAAWLNLNLYNGTAPSTVKLSINCQNLNVGQNPSTTVTVTSGQASNSPETATVRLTVKELPAIITLNPANFSFSCTEDQNLSFNKSMTITNTGRGTLAWSLQENSSWLSVTPASGTTIASGTPSTVTLTANCTGLSAGSYSTDISVSSPGHPEISLKTAQVSLTVNPVFKDKISIEGDFLTANPISLPFPAKIVFMVDCSGSMGTDDPSALRAAAVEDVIDTYNSNPNIYFEIIKFHNDVHDLTNGFTKNANTLRSAVSALSEHYSTTKTIDAMVMARQKIQNDILSLSQSERQRTRYFVVLFSDGAPTYNQYSTFSQVQAALHTEVQNVMNLATSYDIAELRIHSAFLGDINTFYYDEMYELTTRTQVFNATQGLMQDVAQTGQGTYLHFLAATDIDFLNIVSTSIKSPFIIENLFVSNLNTKISLKNGSPTLVSDSDGDGLSDSEEDSLGTSPIKWDTDGDGYGDMIEKYYSTHSPVIVNAGCSDKVRDTDKDGLIDCEESLLGSNINRADTDLDGIPDKIEVINYINPLINDFNSDIDSDGRSNGVEIAEHTNPRLNDSSLPVSERHTYSVTFMGETSMGSGIYKYHLQIGNIGVLTNLLLQGQAVSKNKIEINVTQKSEDNTINNRLLTVGSLTIDIPENVSQPFTRQHALSEFTFATIE